MARLWRTCSGCTRNWEAGLEDRTGHAAPVPHPQFLMFKSLLNPNHPLAVLDKIEFRG